MSTGEIIALVLAACAPSAGVGALVLKIWQAHQERKKAVEMARIAEQGGAQRAQLALNGTTTPRLIDLLEQSLAENAAMREVIQLRQELKRNSEATMLLADEVSPVAGQRTRRKLSDPKGIPVQREVEVHKEHVDTERPLHRTRPGRRTRDE